MKFKFSPDEAEKKLLEEHEFPFTVMMKHGSMTVEYFAPKDVDSQIPHKQDEIYIIIKGHRTFYRNGV